MIEQSVLIQNRLGLHARASAAFATTAGKFHSEIGLRKGDMQVNGKSIMGIMMLAAAKGTHLMLLTDGEDEQAAMQALVGLLADCFGEPD
ncbi:MAG: HPr family phosphocarrier protein [Mariprofundaceae bacterium]|nr:HPr family phosphocarrier protein [Mariprofundaceae bacterium]